MGERLTAVENLWKDRTWCEENTGMMEAREEDVVMEVKRLRKMNGETLETIKMLERKWAEREEGIGRKVTERMVENLDEREDKEIHKKNMI